MSRDDVVFGLHAVRAMLARQPARVRRVWLLAGRHDARVEELRALALAAGVPIGQRGQAELAELAGGGVHQGVIAELAPIAALPESALHEVVQAGEGPPLVLVLDGVQDPHNLGACLRTADAAGVRAVIVPKDRAVGLTPVVRKVAAGAAEAVPLVQVTNLARALRELKELGLWIVGAEAEGDQSLYEADLKGPLAVVMGAEGSGMRRLTREQCDFTVSLPMLGTVESLNVSVAAGVVLYEAVRQRKG